MWKNDVEKVKPKFLKTGTMVRVKPTVAPESAQVEGKFGMRKCFIVDTVEYGKIYISELQFIRLCDLLNQYPDDNTPMSFTL